MYFYCTIYCTTNAAKSTNAEYSRDRSENPFLRNEKKIAAYSPIQMLNKESNAHASKYKYFINIANALR